MRRNTEVDRICKRETAGLALVEEKEERTMMTMMVALREEDRAGVTEPLPRVLTVFSA